MEFLIMISIFFTVSPQSGNLLSGQILKNKSINQLDFLLNELHIFGKINV